MATAPTEDEKKRKAASFGDAAAAAQAPGTTQVNPNTGPAIGSQLANQIPGSSPSGWSGGTGEKITSTELSRNIDNTINALGPLAAGGAAVTRAALATTKAAPAVLGVLGAPAAQTALAYGAPAAAFTALNSASSPSTPATATQPATAAQTPKYESVVPLSKPDVPAVNAPGQAASTATAAAAPPAQAPGTISFDKATNTYSGKNIGADAQIVGGRGVGSISAQNNAAATALADRSSGFGLASMRQPTQDQTQPGLGMNFGTPLSSANSWQARNDLRNLEVSASSINATNLQKQAYQTAQAADQQARTGSDPGTVARTQAGAQMFGAAQAADAQRGATAAGLTQFGQRNKIDQARLGLDTQAAGFQAADQKALADAKAGVLAAKTPQEQEAARQKLASIMGKGEPNYSNRFVKLAGGESDPDKMGVTRKLPDQIFDAETRSMVSGGQAAKAATPPEGTRVRNADGSFGVIKNGILVKEF